MKKVLSLVLSGMLVAATSANAFAATSAPAISTAGVFVDEDFTKPEAEMENPSWAPEGWAFAGIGDKETETINPEGYVELVQNYSTASAQIQYPIAKAIPKNFTLMYDVYFGEDEGRYVYVPSVINGYSLSLNAFGSVSYIDDTGAAKNYATGLPEFDTWYTYIFQVKGDHVTVFRKTADETEFTKVADNLKLQTTTSANTIRMYAFDSSKKLAAARLDNVKLFSGTYLTDSSIEINDEKTLITGTMKISNADIEPESVRNTTVIMAAYDKDGKILKISMNPSNALKYGDDNMAIIEMSLSENLYDNLKGGTVEMYLWDSVSGAKPQCEMHILSVE